MKKLDENKDKDDGVQVFKWQLKSGGEKNQQPLFVPLFSSTTSFSDPGLKPGGLFQHSFLLILSSKKSPKPKIILFRLLYMSLFFHSNFPYFISGLYDLVLDHHNGVWISFSYSTETSLQATSNHDTSLLKTHQEHSLGDKVKSKLPTHKRKHLRSLAPALSPVGSWCES